MSTRKPHSHILDLPADLIAQICSNLSAFDIRSLLSTCRALHIYWPSHNRSFWGAVAETRATLPPFPTSRRRAVVLSDTARALFCTVDGADPCEKVVAPGNAALQACHAESSGLVSASAEGVHLWKGGSWTDAPIHAPGRAPRRGMAGAPTAVAFDEFGRRVAVGLRDRTVLVYDFDGKRDRLVARKCLKGHGGFVSCITFCGGVEGGGGDDVVASGSTDTTIRLHRAASRRGAGVLRGHGTALSYLSAVGDGSRIISCGAPAEARIKLWDVEATTCLATLKCGDAISAVVVDRRRDTAYVASRKSVCVVDLREPNRTAAILSLPRAWRNVGAIPTLTLRKDGLLAAGVGPGAVAVWDACGPWEARGLGSVGWSEYGVGDERLSVRSVALSNEAAVCGRGDGVVSVLGLNSTYGGKVVIPKRRSDCQCAVRALFLDQQRESLLAISREDGSMEVCDMEMRSTEVDWGKAKLACDGDKPVQGASSRFWAEVE